MKIAVVGFGVEGRALAQYFSAKGESVTVCDAHPEIAKNPAFKKLLRLQSKFGPRYLEGLEQFDLIFRSPGVPFLRPEFDAVRGKLTSLTKYFFEHCPCPIVGVTGTKGKGTTSALIAEMLKNDPQAGRRVFFGGNNGDPPIAFLDQLTPADIVILELSSFQLQDLDRSPHVAVVLGITPDHLDHHRSMEEYVEAKKNILRHQAARDFAILDADNPITRECTRDAKADVFLVSLRERFEKGAYGKLAGLFVADGKTVMNIGEKGKTGLLGEHNLKNILAAATAAHLLGVSLPAISRAVREFRGLPHRLEVVSEKAGVRYINDSASTNPETAIAALKTFTAPLILIAGGSEKNLDFRPLGREIAKRLNVKTVILMGQTKAKIERAIEEAVAEEEKAIARRTQTVRAVRRRDVPLELISAETYHEAFMVARMVAQPGDIVLLSPACASFDMFANYPERGEIFRNFVLEYAAGGV